jgi:glycosyltransferase involved in cell wall biosynthesis
MHIGIAPILDPAGGGIYQYNITLLRTLHEATDSDDEYTVFTHWNSSLPEEMWVNRPGWTLKPVGPPDPLPARSLSHRSLDHLRRSIGEGPHRNAWRALRKRLHREENHEESNHRPDPDVICSKPEIGAWFQECGADIMLYPTPLPLSFEAGVPYVMAIHDLQHRLQPEFPEVSADGEWERREYLFRNAARHAELLLADSEVGKEDILNCYGSFGATPDRVKVLPFLPASYLSAEANESQREKVRLNYQLPDRYLFYPAQFWPHKNHVRIVKALDLLKKEYHLNIPIIFCGSHVNKIREQTFHEVNSTVNRLGLNDQVRYLGYAPAEDMSVLYGEATALIMPTFFGPTNIPVLEAWAFGCPVLTSDIRGVREQAGDAALLVDPRSVESIADAIRRLWTDDNLSVTLAERGRQRLAAYTPGD